MIELYSPDTTVFEGGDILSDAYEAVITHERNGRFDLEFKYPLVDGKHKEFETHSIFYTSVPYLGKQAFYMTEINKHLDHVVVYARHIFFMLERNVTKDLHTISGGNTGQLMMDYFNDSLQEPHNFNFKSNIAGRHTYNKPSYNNALEVLVDGKHSILGQWGGVLIMDNWQVRLNDRFGRDTEYLLAKRKNISDIDIKGDLNDITTRLYLSTELEDGTVLETVVDSPLINEYSRVYSDARETEDESVESLQDLIEYGERIFRNQRIDLPKETFEFDVTDDVKDYEFTIDDTALIYYSDYDIYKRVTVSSYEYNPLQDQYLSITFGDKAKSMYQEVSEKVDRDVVTPEFEIIDEIIRDITKNLGNPEGGIIKLRKNIDGNIEEILIVDNEDLDKAKHIWRLNIQGISHSSNGINGEFDVAMTQKGEIVADFIATGTLNAGLIKAGVLSSLNNESWIDMETGSFNFKDNFIWDNVNNQIVFGNQVEMGWGNIVGNDDVLEKNDAIDTEYLTQISKNAITTEFIKTLNLEVGNEIIMGDEATISWDNVDDKSDVLERENYSDNLYLTQISRDAITSAYIKTLNLEVGDEIIMGRGARITWGQVEDTESVARTWDIPTEDTITEITENTIRTGRIYAHNLTVDSANIDGTLTADQITSNISQVNSTLKVGSGREYGAIRFHNDALISATDGAWGVGLSLSAGEISIGGGLTIIESGLEVKGKTLRGVMGVYGRNGGFIDVTSSGIVVRNTKGTVMGSIFYDE